jgi:hypothetical protein
VPGARDHVSLEIALAERPAAVGTRVLDTVIDPVDVEEGKLAALDLDHPALTHRELTGCRHTQTGHG